MMLPPLERPRLLKWYDREDAATIMILLMLGAAAVAGLLVVAAIGLGLL